MKPSIITIFALCLSASAYERLQGPTEVLFHDPSKACAGYTFFGVGNRTWLIDMEGRVVHSWPVGTNPHLLDNGHILDASKDDPSGFQGFKEVDWDGRTVWEYTEKREGYAPHHDWVRIHNKALNAPTTLYIANKTISYDEAVAAGADPQQASREGGQMDAIVEVDMGGNIVWEWCFFDHVVQDIDPAKPNHAGTGKSIADHPGRININMPGRPLRLDWLHCNSMDYNAESGHDGTFVAGDSKAGIAKAAGPGGDFLYRFGDPARYGQGDPPRVLENWDSATTGHKQMGGSHDAHWIAQGLPGAGHLMVFNNGQYLYQRTPGSSILEINPLLDANGRATGKYVNPPDAGYRRETYDHDTHNQAREISNQIVWSYRSVNSHGFFSHIGSSGQRLPNGNTFICSDTEGHFFEVTAKGELAWEYINPVTRDGPVKVLGDVLPMTNSAFRAYRYGSDHPAFKGRELTAKGTITERAEQGVDVYQKKRAPQEGAKGVPGKGGQRKAGEGGGGQGKGRQGSGGPHGERPAENGVPRMPWPVVHAKEMDANQDGVLTRDEMKAEVSKTLAGGDADKDGRLSAQENSAGVRSAFGGFAKQHAKEIDTDQDGFITAAELVSIALRMFDKADANGDGKLSGEELALPPGYQPTPPAPSKK
jgi:hypothetical protein